MKNRNWGALCLAAVLACAVGSVTGCKKNETAGDAIDRNADSAKDGLKSAGDKMKEAGEKTKDALKNAADKTGDALKNAADKVKTSTSTNS